MKTAGFSPTSATKTIEVGEDHHLRKMDRNDDSERSAGWRKPTPPAAATPSSSTNNSTGNNKKQRLPRRGGSDSEDDEDGGGDGSSSPMAPSYNAYYDEMFDKSTTARGQMEMNPGMSEEEAKAEAKKAYNRANVSKACLASAVCDLSLFSRPSR